MGVGVSTNHKFSNGIELSQLGQDLLQQQKTNTNKTKPTPTNKTKPTPTKQKKTNKTKQNQHQQNKTKISRSEGIPCAGSYWL